MPGDYSKLPLPNQKHYKKVNWQQGRVGLDSDYNEQNDISYKRETTFLNDIIGDTGAANENAFQITTDSATGSYNIGNGQYYVDGILCENEVTIDATQQMDLKQPPPGISNPSAIDMTKAGYYLVYLDAWDREITSIEDPDIKEVALNGADTTTRTKTVWQVKTQSLGTAPVSCNDCISNFPDRKTFGMMQARTQRPEDQQSVCDLPPTAKYTGLQNQLYRVQIHDPSGDGNQVTFKYSKNNASVTYEATITDGSNTILLSGATNPLYSLKSGDWVEITDDTHELFGKPGTFVQVTDVDSTGDLIKFSPPTGGDDITSENFPINPKIIAWDNKPQQLTTDGWIDLEDDGNKIGIQIQFSDGTFNTGDFWTIPARVALNDIEFPKTLVLPQGIVHHYAPLAIVHSDGTKFVDPDYIDCRKVFPSLTELDSLYYLGGDAQAGAPGTPLPLPLVAGVATGSFPVQNASVNFKIISGTKGNIEASPGMVATQNQDGSITIKTNDKGIVSCQWTLDPTEANQQVEASLLDSECNQTHLPIFYNAALKTMGAGNCSIVIPPGHSGQQIQDFIKNSLSKPDGGKICFPAGTFYLDSPITISKKRNLLFEGAGKATRIIIRGHESAFIFDECANIQIENLSVQTVNSLMESKTNKKQVKLLIAGKDNRKERKHTNGVLNFLNCERVNIRSVHLTCSSGNIKDQSCLTFRGTPTKPASEISVSNCRLSIGWLQVGILLVNCQEVDIHDNKLEVSRFRGHVLLLRMRDLCKSRWFRTLVNMLQSNNERIRDLFGLQGDIQSRLNKIAIGTIGATQLGALSGFLGITGQDLLGQLFQNISQDVLQNKTAKTLQSYYREKAYLAFTGIRKNSSLSQQERNFIYSLRRGLAAGLQGIVVGGVRGSNVKIRNNTIYGVMQGIHIGASIEGKVGRTLAPSKNMDDVDIYGNRIDLVSPWWFVGEKHGIFVGNTDTASIKDNLITIAQTGLQWKQSSVTPMKISAVGIGRINEKLVPEVPVEKMAGFQKLSMGTSTKMALNSRSYEMGTIYTTGEPPHMFTYAYGGEMEFPYESPHGLGFGPTISMPPLISIGSVAVNSAMPAAAILRTGGLGGEAVTTPAPLPPKKTFIPKKHYSRKKRRSRVPWTEGIKLYGYFGERILISGNQITTKQTSITLALNVLPKIIGINFNYLGTVLQIRGINGSAPTRTNYLWMIFQNVVAGADIPYDIRFTNQDNGLPIFVNNVPMTTPPDPPPTLTANLAGNEINLAWSAPANTGGTPITGYKIERSINGTHWDIIQPNVGIVTTYSDSMVGGLAELTITFYYRVSAINATGTSIPSPVASVKLQLGGLM